jgi:hypothetical protein
VATEATKHDIETAGRHPDVIKSELFEATVEKTLSGPIFVIDYPAAVCPLTKRKTGSPDIAERFELYVAGMELANAYTELNDPLLQDELFRTQLDGLDDEDSMAKLDTEFLEALKIGMPPAGGLGVGIDRLVMLLTNSRSIRDVIFFPLLRPETQPDAKSSEPNPEMNDPSDEVTKTNVGDGEVYGVEFAASWQLADDWRLDGTASWAEGSQDTFPTSAPVIEREPMSRMQPRDGTVGPRYRRAGRSL